VPINIIGPYLLNLQEKLTKIGHLVDQFIEIFEIYRCSCKIRQKKFKEG
jgi:hypothetical protein